ncbi:MOSC domain-containing protein [Aureimonas leprariae]|uniref:MOSC domain-containing protein n=1 Tax=Plantimonas leprariae TaxID=2615207 RepID=A0A7V7PN35_9HYPH|nr:MOSC domain-containing protein [Aureimonas leprariae]KAB0679016.1 MOSC domain-containing protein [Aureimonas leprariae]
MSGVALRELMTGPVRPLGAKGVPSGIAKTAVSAPTELTAMGFVGDAQGDTVRHGGTEKAVHHYPFEHYASWARDLGPRDLLDRPGAFGENLSTFGLSEEDVAVGDVFEIGTALLEVAQGRQPCWKLNERFGFKAMARLVQSSGRTGWYYRVLRPGIVGPGDALRLLHRADPQWTIARIRRLFYVDTLNRNELEHLSRLDKLAKNWRDHALRRLRTSTVEDWTARLDGVDATKERHGNDHV